MTKQMGKWVEVGKFWLNTRTGQITPVIRGAALPATDTFTTGSDQALTTYSASWTANTGAFYVIAASDTVRPNSTGAYEAAHWNADSFNDNQYAQVVASTMGTSFVFIGPAVRVATSADTWYGFMVSNWGALLKKSIASTVTDLGDVGAAFAATDIVRIEASGTTITPKKNGALLNPPGAQTDASIASGYAGLCGNDASDVILADNWEGGNLATESASVSPSVSPSPSPTPSESASISPSASVSPSVSPSISPSASVSPSVSLSVSPSISPSASVSPSISPSVSPSESPSVSPSISPSSSVSPSASVSPSISQSASVSLSVSASVSPSAPVGVIVDIDHEENDFSDYDSVTDADGDLSVTAQAALGGTNYGLSCLIDDENAMYGTVTNLASMTGDARARFHVDPNGLSMPDGSVFTILALKNSSGFIFAIVRLAYTTANGYQIVAGIVNDAVTYTYTTFSLGAITDSEHCIEIYVQRATGESTNDGSIQLWIDGTDIQTLSNVDNFIRFASLNSIDFGIISTWPSLTGTLYLDELIVRDDGTEIGCLAIPSASVSPSVSSSVSPSISPSASESPSVSLSVSPSISPSVSPSISPSASVSPSISPSASISLSVSPSESPSISPSVPVSPT